MKHAVEKVGPQPACPMKLETYVSPNFIGLFISEEYAEYFKALSLQYVKEIQGSFSYYLLYKIQNHQIQHTNSIEKERKLL